MWIGEDGTHTHCSECWSRLHSIISMQMECRNHSSLEIKQDRKKTHTCTMTMIQDEDYDPRHGLTYYVVTRCLCCFFYLEAKDPFLPIKCCIFACISLEYPCVFHQLRPGWGALQGQLGTDAWTKNCETYLKDKKKKKQIPFSLRTKFNKCSPGHQERERERKSYIFTQWLFITFAWERELQNMLVPFSLPLGAVHIQVTGRLEIYCDVGCRG